MRKLRNKVILACALILSGTLPWVSIQAASYAPHKMPCQSCHLESEVNAQDIPRLLASQESLCGHCHADVRQSSHPSGFRPNRALPAGYPLDGNEQMTCSTCHNVHLGEVNDTYAAGDQRGNCRDCHSEAFFTTMSDQGASIQGIAHLAVVTTSTTGLSMDASTRQCLSCHGEDHGGRSASHPVGVRYDEAVKTGMYHRAATLDPAILLPEGKVGCVSCHRGYSREHGELVRSNSHSALCLSCHNR